MIRTIRNQALGRRVAKAIAYRRGLRNVSRKTNQDLRRLIADLDLEPAGMK